MSLNNIGNLSLNINCWLSTRFKSIFLNRVDSNSNESDERTVFYHSEVEENLGFNLFGYQRILFQMLIPDRAKRFFFCIR